jgi:DNA-binding winged helix-turn-helix (wHTH) protein
LLYRFNDFVLIPTGELRRDPDVAVEPVFDLLEFHSGCERVVGRDDLLAAVWKGRLVSEATLSSRVNSAPRWRQW